MVTHQRAADFDPTEFDLVAVNGQLRQLARRILPGDVTPEDRETVLGPVFWFLNAAHPDGLELTSAGYLKPAIVKQATTRLGWDDQWPMPGRNEINVIPILDLREQLQDWKLLRKFKGKLVLTPAGRRVVQDPAALWDYLAERLAFPQHGVDKEVIRLLVHWAVSGEAPPYSVRREVIQSVLHAKGYRMPGVAGVGQLDFPRRRKSSRCPQDAILWASAASSRLKTRHAEGKGFEPLVRGYRTLVFKTSSLGRSDNLPCLVVFHRELAAPKTCRRDERG